MPFLPGGPNTPPLCSPLGGKGATPTTGGQVQSVSDPSPPDIGIRIKVRAEGPHGAPHPGKTQKPLLPPLWPDCRAWNPKRLEHWGTPRQSLRWTRSSGSEMTLSPSERQLLAGVGRAVDGSPSRLCPARRGSGEVGHSWEESCIDTCTNTVPRQGAVATLVHPQGPESHLQGLSLRLLSAPLRKRAVEAELDTCRAKLHAVEAQLLEVREEKLRLRQEVEAWEVRWVCWLGLGGRARQAQAWPLTLLFWPPGGHATAGVAAG